MQEVWKANGFVMYKAKAKDILGYKPSSTQKLNKKGKVVLKESRVLKIMGFAVDSLNNPEGFFTVTSDNHIISGHHRQEAIRRLMENGTLTGNEDVYICVRDVTNRSLAAQKANMAANNTVQDAVYTKLVRSDLAFSNQLMKPIFKMLQKTNKEHEGVLTNSDMERLTVKLGAVLDMEHKRNAESGWYDDFLKNKKIVITGSALYSKKDGMAGKWAAEETTDLDLRRYEDVLEELFIPFVKLTTSLKKDNLWKEKLGNNTNFFYPLLAKSLRRELTVTTCQKITKNFSAHGAKLKNAFRKEFMNATVSAEDSIWGILLPE